MTWVILESHKWIDNVNFSHRISDRTEDGAYCELCEIFLPIPVTFHMRVIHPGCGKKSKSKGYNSVGAYCDGWAGNCGEGGKGASSWYLMCESCRDRLVHIPYGILCFFLPVIM